MATSKPTESTSKKSSVVKKAAPKVATAKPAKTTATKSASTRKKTPKTAIITSEERYKMIEVAAYYIAEKNGFGHQYLDYWLAAEKEVNAKLNA